MSGYDAVPPDAAECLLLPAYHVVEAAGSRFLYSTTRAQFEEHLRAMSRMRGPEAERAWLSFDDGHASQYLEALPVLQQLAATAQFFVVAGWVNQRAAAMGSAQLRELVSLGHEVGTHGLTHCMLTRCPAAQLTVELAGSRERLQQLLGSPVLSVSIPFGRWDARVLAACAEAGYRRVYTSDPWPVIAGPAGLEVHGRFMVRRGTSARTVCDAMRGNGAALRLERALQHSKRLARRLLGEDFYHSLWGVVASRKSLHKHADGYAARSSKP